METNQTPPTPSQENKQTWHAPQLETFGEVEIETAVKSS